MLEAKKEDELADFNPEDFKRLEKEDRDFRRRKGKNLQRVYTGHVSTSGLEGCSIIQSRIQASRHNERTRK